MESVPSDEVVLTDAVVIDLVWMELQTVVHIVCTYAHFQIEVVLRWKIV